VKAIAGILFPVFGVILCGYLAGRWKALGPGGAEVLNRFVYYFALPPLLFTLTAEAGVASLFNAPFILAYLGGMIATLLVALAGGYLIYGHRSLELAFHGFAAVFSNSAYMGIPLFITAFGPQGALPAIVATITSNMLLIGGVVMVAEVSRSKAGGVIEGLKAGMARNPLLAASLLGILFSACGFSLPRPAGDFLHLIGAAAAPAALFALGMSLVGIPWRAGAGEVCWLSALKLLVQPAATWLLAARVFSMDPLWQAAAVLIAGMPVGALAFVITRQYGAYFERASAAIVVSTMLSALSLAVILSLLHV
jgi:malonate transporter and related proteins